MEVNLHISSKIISYINHNKLFSTGSKLVIGLSGGPDSVFLLHVLAELKDSLNISLIAAHLDHQWRENSHNDVLFCRNLAETLQVPFVTNSINELGKEFISNGSLEAKGRAARRYFLEKVANDHNADAITLGHHLQDQEETFFIRLIRGSSLTGLKCMLPKDGKYIRPLLETNKSEIVEYLDAHNIAYLTDPTNEQHTYLRNRIRAKVLPALQECDERFDGNFLSTLHCLQEAEEYLQKETEKIYREITNPVHILQQTQDMNGLINTSNKCYLKLESFLQLHPFMQHRIIIYWLIQHKVPFTPSEALLQEILRFLQHPAGGVHAIHTSWRINKKKNLASIEYL